jgi:hypothetical protein
LYTPNSLVLTFDESNQEKIIMPQSVTKLFRLPGFYVALCTPIAAAIGLASYIACNSVLTWEGGYIGLNNSWEIFKTPLAILALAFPFVALVTANHRSIQSKKQIETSLEQNRISIKPVLCESRGIEEGKCFYLVKNKGLGTAEIDGFKYIIDAQSVSYSYFRDELVRDFEGIATVKIKVSPLNFRATLCTVH